MSKVSGFTFFSSYHESLKDLDREDKRDLLEAIVDYVFDDVNPEFVGFKRTIWTLISPNLTTSKNKSKNAKKDTKKKQTKIKSKSKSNQNENNDLLEDKDKEMDKGDGKEDKSSSSTTRRNLYEIIEQNFGRPISPLEYEKINKWQEEFSDDIIEYAIQKSVLINKRNFSYVNGILKNWKSNGYRTLQEIKDTDYSERPKPDQEYVKLFEYNWLEDHDE